MNQEQENNKTNRRNFLLRLVKGTMSIATACSLSYWLYDSIGPAALPNQKDLVTLPDFSIPDLKGRMSIVTGPERIKTLSRALTGVGGIEAFIEKGDRVLLKVNAAFATPPILSATTNPQLTAEVVRLCYAAGASSVVVTDNPINDPASCFSLTGIAEAARSQGARVLLPRERLFQPTTVPNGTLIRNWPILWEPFLGTNKVIGIAPVKDHHRSGASMTMKNWYGLLGGRRNIFHQDINTIITELAMLVKPTLVILDGTTTMIANGPTGGSLADLKQTNTMIVSTDQVAADAFGATLLGKTVAELPYIVKAEAAGLGTADYEALSPARVNVS
ncbi:MAG: DUF362 domain-containing protein [Syntrophobacteria bacterium]|nr:DUF362 domain-containing protein [Deltaproteobacteria bacterium]